MNKQVIENTVLNQREFFNSGVTRNYEFRKQNLKNLHKLIEDNEKNILDALHDDMGKPALEGYLSEIYFAVKEIRYALKNLKKWMKPRKVQTEIFTFPSKNYIYHDPLGLVLLIGPWNYPFQLVVGPLVPAIAAGNCAILKPSELAPATSQLIGNLISDNFEKHYITVVEGGPEIATELLKYKYDHIFYTGNERVGRIVLEAAAKQLTPVTLELGGKNPCIVIGDGNLDKTVRKIVLGKYFNCGQTCVAPDYVYVPEKIKDVFIEKTVEYIKKFYGNMPVQSRDYSRIINSKHFERLKSLVTGNTVMVGDHDQDNLKFAPVIVVEPSSSDPVMQEEIFGPILPVLTYKELDEVIQTLAGLPKPLALYLFTEDAYVQEKVLSCTFSGGCAINDIMMQITTLRAPFGGVGNSGMGNYHGKYGFQTFSHAKSVMKKSLKFDIFSVYPPYKNTYRWLRKIVK